MPPPHRGGLPLPQPLAQLAAPPTFVVGLHRSGTTWIYDLLTAHPEVAGVFESGMFATDLGFGPLFDPTHWAPGETGEKQKQLFGSARLRQLMRRDEMVDEVRAVSARWLARPLRPEHRYLVEKTPQHGYVMPLIAELFPGAGFIQVIRDGRDVAVSVEAAARSWGGFRYRGHADHGKLWADGVSTIRRAAHNHELRYTEVRYEDMRSAPVARLRELTEFVGIPADEPTLQRMVDAASIEKLQTGPDDQFRRRGNTGDWADRFGLRDRRRFHRGAGQTLLDLGYETTRWWWLRPGGQGPAPNRSRRKGAAV